MKIIDIEEDIFFLKVYWRGEQFFKKDVNIFTNSDNKFAKELDELNQKTIYKLTSLHTENDMSDEVWFVPISNTKKQILTMEINNSYYDDLYQKMMLNPVPVPITITSNNNAYEDFYLTNITHYDRNKTIIELTKLISGSDVKLVIHNNNCYSNRS